MVSFLGQREPGRSEEVAFVVVTAAEGCKATAHPAVAEEDRHTWDLVVEDFAIAAVAEVLEGARDIPKVVPHTSSLVFR